MNKKFIAYVLSIILLTFSINSLKSMEWESYETDYDNVTFFNPKQLHRSQEIPIPQRTSYYYYEQDSDDDEENKDDGEKSRDTNKDNYQKYDNENFNPTIILNSYLSESKIILITIYLAIKPDIASLDDIINTFNKNKQLYAKAQRIVFEKIMKEENYSDQAIKDIICIIQKMVPCI